MKLKIYSILISSVLIFHFGCVSYKDIKIDNMPTTNTNSMTIGYSIYTPTIFGLKIIDNAIQELSKSYNYKFQCYDINKDSKVDSDYERYYKIVEPNLIYSKEEINIIIYFGPKHSKTNNCLMNLSALTLFIIPFYGKYDEKVTIDIIKNNIFLKRYEYNLEGTLLVQLLLIPNNFTKSNEKKTQEAIRNVLTNFIADAQKDKLL